MRRVRFGSSLLPAVTLAAALWSAATSPAQEGAGLEVKPDRRNVVANALIGEWRLDQALQDRLGGPAEAGDRIAFREDAAVLAKVPRQLAEKLRSMRLFLAGTMTRKGKEHAFLLTELNGNPTVVWFRERNGDPLGDAESNNVMLARGAVPQADLLFVGGDSDNQPFACYARAQGPRPQLQPSAAVAQMIQLLEAGRTVEFVREWCAPEDMEAVKTEAERAVAVERLAKRLAEGKRDRILEALRAAAKQEPAISADGNEAIWTIDGEPSRLRLTRVDGRWYMRNR